MDQGLYGGIFGAEVRFLCFLETGWISSMSSPFLDNLEELFQLKLKKDSEWYKRYVNQINVFVEKASDNFGISNLIVLDGFNFIFDLIGATNTYVAAMEEPEVVRKAIDFAFDLNVEIHNDFFNIVPVLDNGTCSIEVSWVPGKIITESVDPFHMTNVDYFEEWGREPVERLFAKFDGGIIHIHSNGRHLLESVSTIKGLKAINLFDEKGYPTSFSILDKIKKQTKSTPISLEVSLSDFNEGLDKHTLTGGILYKVNQVKDIDSANRLMERVRRYRA
jgi:hypothetical protein